MGADESHRAYVTYFRHLQASSVPARLPTRASFWKPRMEVAHHDAYPVPSGLLVAWGQHYPSLVLGGASRRVDAGGMQTSGMACDCHALAVAVQGAENPLDKASMYAAEEHRLGDQFQGPY